MRKISLKSKKAEGEENADRRSESKSSNNGDPQNGDDVDSEDESDPLAIDASDKNGNSKDRKSRSKKSKKKVAGKKMKAASKAKAPKETPGDAAEDDTAEGDDDAEEEYEVEEVIDSQKVKGKTLYLIRWKGYGADSDTWEPEDTLSCPGLITKYLESAKYTEKSSPKGKKSPSKKLKREASPSSKSKSKSGSPAKKSKPDESVDPEAEYEVDRIIEVHHKKKGGREFLIRWKGWGPDGDSWEPEENLSCPDLIAKFMDKVNSAAKSSRRELRETRKHTDHFILSMKGTGRRLSKRHDNKQRITYHDAE